ncbi:MAG: hypothetical protein WD825_13920 [Gemmatimonadaceae bacterium]
MRLITGCILGLALLLLSPSSTHAEPPTPGSGYGPRPNRPTVVETNVVATAGGVTIFIGVTTTIPGTPGAPGSTEIVNVPAAPVCTATVPNIGYNSSFARQLPEHPGELPWVVTCDNGLFTIVWIPVNGPGVTEIVVQTLPEPPTDPRSMAQSLFGMVPLPPVAVGANPDTGLVALPSWFWVDGYGGETLYGSETLGDTTVDVEITPQRYDWSFGDGAALSTESLGRRYPLQSDIQHSYERSLTADVRLEITFGGRYRVTTIEDDGEGGFMVVVGPWEALAPMVRSWTTPYPVRQLQSVLTAGR